MLPVQQQGDRNGLLDVLVSSWQITQVFVDIGLF
jgi:hypothetical protein